MGKKGVKAPPKGSNVGDKKAGGGTKKKLKKLKKPQAAAAAAVEEPSDADKPVLEGPSPPVDPWKALRSPFGGKLSPNDELRLIDDQSFPGKPFHPQFDHTDRPPTHSRLTL